jgi:hypothetical protein
MKYYSIQSFFVYILLLVSLPSINATKKLSGHQSLERCVDMIPDWFIQITPEEKKDLFQETTSHIMQAYNYKNFIESKKKKFITCLSQKNYTQACSYISIDDIIHRYVCDKIKSCIRFNGIPACYNQETKTFDYHKLYQCLKVKNILITCNVVNNQEYEIISSYINTEALEKALNTQPYKLSMHAILQAIHTDKIAHDIRTALGLDKNNNCELILRSFYISKNLTICVDRTKLMGILFPHKNLAESDIETLVKITHFIKPYIYECIDYALDKWITKEGSSMFLGSCLTLSSIYATGGFLYTCSEESCQAYVSDLIPTGIPALVYAGGFLGAGLIAYMYARRSHISFISNIRKLYNAYK